MTSMSSSANIVITPCANSGSSSAVMTRVVFGAPVQPRRPNATSGAAFGDRARPGRRQSREQAAGLGPRGLDITALQRHTQRSHHQLGQLGWSAHLDEFCRNGGQADVVHHLERGRNQWVTKYSCALLFPCQPTEVVSNDVRDVSRGVAGLAGPAVGERSTTPPCTKGAFRRTGHPLCPEIQDGKPSALKSEARISAT